MVVPNSLTNCGFFVYSYSPPVLLCLEGTNHSKYGVTKVNIERMKPNTQVIYMINMHM